MVRSIEPKLNRHHPHHPRGRRSTPPGQHRPVLLDEVLAALDPRPGQVVVDCTAGWGGHAGELLRRVGPSGRLVAFDLDPDNLPRARERLESVGGPFRLHHGNFAGVQNVLAAEDVPAVDAVLADLGMSSLQVDDPGRGFSYVRDGPLDMRMDRSRGRTAAQVLAAIAEDDLRRALHDLGDEPQAERVARAIVRARDAGPIERTADLARVVREATEGDADRPHRLHPRPGQWNIHPAARTFQALRILVNRELANLEQLLRVLPAVLKPGGRAAIISFHSGEDRLVKAAFRDGLAAGHYARVSPDPVRPGFEER
ncbi:MAG TPA: 16S rRNA (cytosine(1402)-N(4))-methyltransferase RsmH, partial [Gemmataceae bacterium]|nr:16S rRNA (cytosine(1402)-N(4))-methyltransferase RsmH [Gemmataceae bacterium]